MSSGLATSFGMLQAVAKREFDTGDLNPTDESPMTPRCRVLHMGVLVGSLCSAMLTNAPFDEKREPLEQMTGSETVQDFSSSTAASTFWTSPEHESARDKVAQAMGTLFWALVVTAGACSLDLRECIVKKLELNGRKYPVELCKGKSGKYTAYSDRTGITKTEGQSTIGADSTMSSVETIEEMIRTIRRFATDRQWTRFHSPRSILLALMGELGELAELFQWKGDDHELVGLEGWKKEEVDKVGQELADVSIYLLRLADVCCIYNIGPLTLKAGGYTSSNH